MFAMPVPTSIRLVIDAICCAAASASVAGVSVTRKLRSPICSAVLAYSDNLFRGSLPFPAITKIPGVCIARSSWRRDYMPRRPEPIYPNPDVAYRQRGTVDVVDAGLFAHAAEQEKSQ